MDDTIVEVHGHAKQDAGFGCIRVAGLGTLFDARRFHALFSTTPADTVDTIAADRTHRGHAIIEQVQGSGDCVTVR